MVGSLWPAPSTQTQQTPFCFSTMCDFFFFFLKQAPEVLGESFWFHSSSILFHSNLDSLERALLALAEACGAFALPLC